MRGELETEQNCNILTPPQLFWLQQHFFPVLLGCSTGGLGPSLCCNMVLIPASSLQLIDFLSHPGYIIIWRSPASWGVTIRTQFNPSTVKVNPDIFDRIHLLFTQVHFSSDSSAGSEVNMLHLCKECCFSCWYLINFKPIHFIVYIYIYIYMYKIRKYATFLTWFSNINFITQFATNGNRKLKPF